MMRRPVHKLVFCLAILLGGLGLVLKLGPDLQPKHLATRFIHPEVADLAIVLPLSNQGPYDAHLYKGRGCLGQIWLLPLHRNGEAASLLPAVQGFVLDGRQTDSFPAIAHAAGQVLHFTGLRHTAPQVLAFAETGGCNLLSLIDMARS